MKIIAFLSVVLFSSFSFAQSGQILQKVYGSLSKACTQDADADTGEDNRLAMGQGYQYLVYCHDGAGAGSACECLQGTVTVDASAAVGMTMFAGEKVIVTQKLGHTHISCVPYADDQYIDVCRME